MSNKRELLTLEQLREMDGKPAYWPKDDSYGIISVDGNGKWARIPFFRGRKNGVQHYPTYIPISRPNNNQQEGGSQ